MKIPLRYIIRNLLQRKSSTFMTIASFTLVVFALIALLSMLEGVNRVLINAGQPDRLFVINENATNENQSRLSPKESLILSTFPEIRLDHDARPMISEEIVKTTYIEKNSSIRIQTNFRGVDLNAALKVHYGIKLLTGRMFNPDSPNEVIVGKSIYNGLDIDTGEQFTSQNTNWTIVGVFEDNGSIFESEVWTSRTNLVLLTGSTDISSVWILVKNPRLTKSLVQSLNKNPSLPVFAISEQDYFEQGTTASQGFLALTWFITIMMSIGAIFSAMNTMFASLADRAGELAALRAIGFQIQSIRLATLIESSAMAVTGGIIASLISISLNGIMFRTLMTGLGYVTFEITVTPFLITTGLLFAVFMGILGGWIPARHATKIPIIEALNE